MDIEESKIGQWPNVAIEAGTPPEEAMERHRAGRGGRDTPDKLEADVQAWFWNHGGCTEAMAREWLDRQAAITRRECHAADFKADAAHQKARADRAEERCNTLRASVAGLKGTVERQRARIAELEGALHANPRGLDADWVGTCLVRFAQDWMEADDRVAEYRCVQGFAREIAGAAGGHA